MTPRETIRRVLTFEDAPRIGLCIGGKYPNDMIHVWGRWSEAKPVEPQGNEIRRWVDEWGVTWASLTEFDKGEVVAGALEDWSDLDSWQGPNLAKDEHFAHAREVLAGDDEHFRVGHLPGFTFNIARKLRKLDNYLCDLALERDKIDQLHEKIRPILMKTIDRWAAVGVDAIMFPEDWGTQDRLMVSPEMWRDIFKPEFVALAGRAHEHGMLVIMHSCGKITEAMDDMIDAGIDAFQFDQPTLHGIDTLAERFGGRTGFWCPVDIQKTLQTKDPDKIRAEAAELAGKLFTFGGGFIAGRYPSDESIGLDPKIQDIACDAFVELATDQMDAQSTQL